MRYCVFALTLVVGFAVGFLVPVVSDVFVDGWPVTPRQAVAEITQPPTPPREITQPPTPNPASIKGDAFRALVRCLDSSAKSSYLPRWWERLDDGSGAYTNTIAQLMIPTCGSEVDAYFAVPSEKVAKILREGVYGIAVQFLNRDEQISDLLTAIKVEPVEPRPEPLYRSPLFWKLRGGVCPQDVVGGAIRAVLRFGCPVQRLLPPSVKYTPSLE
jgi:hypothetical protein